MKKILFMLINMNIGGTEKAFLNMLEEMPQTEYEITLLMLEERGGFLNKIPQGVKVRYLEGFRDMKGVLDLPPLLAIKQLFLQGHYLKGIKLMGVNVLSKLRGERSPLFKYILKNTKVLEEYYDVAVAYAGPMEFITYFIVKKINAHLKVQWIHFDVTKIGFNTKFARRYYKNFNRIFIVSEQGKQNFLKLVPSLKDKTETFFNRVSEKQVLSQAMQEQGFEDGYEGIRILTVGRLSEEKGQDLCIEACKKLREVGYEVRWYCIGEGGYRSKCEVLREKYNLQEDFILLGAKENPYPYMQKCNIYVQSSRHEGYCITLAEAKLFNKPIVATDFVGAREQIIEGKTGLVVQVTADALYQGIKSVLDRTVVLD